jgi:hypothetical protein
MVRATIIASFSVKGGGEYSTANISVEIFEMLRNNTFFQAYSNLYQYYNVKFVKLFATPNFKEGSAPPIGYVMLQGNDVLGIQYSDIPKLPQAKKIYSGATSIYSFSRTGRQEDFNYWYNTNDNVPLAFAMLKFRFDEPFNQVATGLGYTFRLKYHVIFKSPFPKEQNKIKVEEEHDEVKEAIAILTDDVRETIPPNNEVDLID